MLYGTCFICKHTIVDKHRIVPGRAGGKYTNDNVVEMCNWHHREVHRAYREKFGTSYYKENHTRDEYLAVILHMRIRYLQVGSSLHEKRKLGEKG